MCILLVLLGAFAFNTACSPGSHHKLIVGIQNQDCDYSFTQDDLLNEGADQVLALGARGIGIYMGPEYREIYPGISDGAGTLLELAQTDAFRRLLNKPFSVISITCYAFAGGLKEKWQSGIQSYDTQMEYWELRELVEYLLREFDGSGRTFILKNWEGDWQLLGRYDYYAEPDPEAVDAMIRWLNARTEAVRDARETVSVAQGVSVFSAVEFNFLQKTWYGHKTCLSEVVPHTQADLYSYSAWDSMEEPENLSHLLSFIKKYAPDSGAFGQRNIMIGAFGFPDSVTNKVNHVRRILSIFDNADVPFCFLWQIYDNECDLERFMPLKNEPAYPLNCVGYGLVDQMGRHTPVWHYLNKEVFGRAR